MRKKLILGLMAMTAWFTVASPALSRDLIFGTDTAFVPFSFKQGDTYVGFDVDLWDAIAKDMGVTYKLMPMDFTGIVPGLQSGQIDLVMAGISITDARKRVVDFSEPYYHSGLLLLVRADSNIKSAEDLKGKIIALKTGTGSVTYADEHFPDVGQRQFPNVDNAFLELQTGRVDAVLHDAPNVLYYAATGGKGKVKTIGNVLEAQDYGAMFAKGSDLVARYNASLEHIKANGIYDKIYQKWFGSQPK